MPQPRAVLSRPNRTDRAQQRRGLGSLSQRVLQPGTRTRYELACRWFFAWLRSWQVSFPRDAFELDDCLCRCIDQAWDEGESYTLIGDLLSGIAAFVPRLRAQMPAAWRLHSAWRRLELPCRAWPLSEQQAMALAYSCLVNDCWDVGLLILMAFHGILRTHEALDARKSHFSWSTSALHAYLSLPQPKAPTEQEH